LCVATISPVEVIGSNEGLFGSDPQLVEVGVASTCLDAISDQLLFAVIEELSLIVSVLNNI